MTDSDSASSRGSSPLTEDPSLMKLYTTMMLDLIDIPTNESPDEPLEPIESVLPGNASTATGAKRRKMDKKKLKREEAKQAKEGLVTEIDFRLLAGQPVRLISLLPAEEDFQAVQNPRHVSLTPEARAELAEQVKLTVVEGTDIKRGALVLNASSTSPSHQQPLPDYLLNTCLPLPIPLTIAIIERPRSLISSISLTGQPAPKRQPPNRTHIPHLKSLYTPEGRLGTSILPISRTEQRQQSRQRKKISNRENRLGLRSVETSLSGKTQKIIKKHEAKFWAPDKDLGGKARGYAYGFIGSREGARRQVGWARDKMKKACYPEE